MVRSLLCLAVVGALVASVASARSGAPSAAPDPQATSPGAAVSPPPAGAAVQPAATIAGDDSYARTLSPDGSIESAILLHSRMGIRVELNLHRKELQLWLSPQAGKSLDYRDRNFSNRDDHTRIFDRIWFPELAGKPFVRCDYDPFHSVIRFEGQVLHLATLLDQPVVLVWFESEEVVDFKSDKQDTPLARTAVVFGVRHPDRGKVLDFVAALGAGAAVFQHQRELDEGRSTYARAVLAPGQLLAIGGELSGENVEATVSGVAARPARQLLDQNERKIAEAVRPGALVLDGAPEMQRLYDTNRRHLLSVQDASGALRAALRYVYYLIWTTDGSVTATSMAQAGNAGFLERWLEFLLANPTVQSTPPEGRFYGQLTNRITKREEFGTLCAVWPAFWHFGQTGDRRFVTGENLRVLEDAADWMERYTYDPALKAYGTYYAGGGSEDPFFASHDFGFDAAVGSFMSRRAYAPRHEDALILRAYEFGTHLNQYNIALMLAAVTEGAKAARYREKAAEAERFMQRLDQQQASAYYLLEGRGLTLVRGRTPAMDGGLLAVQNESPAFFMPEFARRYLARMRAFRPLTADGLRDQYACAVYGRLAGLDTEFVDEQAIVASLEASLPYNVRPSRFIPMPYTMVEVFGATEGTFHDIRPQAFSTGPFQAALTNLALRTLPFGVALRGSRLVRQLDDFEYRGGRLNVRFEGRGRLSTVEIEGRPLQHTLQLPDERLTPGATTSIVARLQPAAPAAPTLVYSTVRLLDVSAERLAIRYRLEGFAQNVLVFRDAPGAVTIRDGAGRKVRTTETRDGRHLFVEFQGKGPFVADVSRP